MTFALALLGGFFSFASTGLGAMLAPRLVARGESMQATRRWLDFAIGVMLSSVAFSLLGPEILHAVGSSVRMWQVVAGAVAGLGFVALLQLLLKHPRLKSSEFAKGKTNAKILLAAVLILHNFPEGMGAGASLAGMTLVDAIPVQAALAAQNIVEGAILTLCFVGFGWSWRRAIVGGFISGVIEWSGAAVAGIGLQYSHALLSPLLAAAGGAMLISVLLEIREQKEEKRSLNWRPFALGFALIPVMNFVLS